MAADVWSMQRARASATTIMAHFSQINPVPRTSSLNQSTARQSPEFIKSAICTNSFHRRGLYTFYVFHSRRYISIFFNTGAEMSWPFASASIYTNHANRLIQSLVRDTWHMYMIYSVNRTMISILYKSVWLLYHGDMFQPPSLRWSCFWRELTSWRLTDPRLLFSLQLPQTLHLTYAGRHKMAAVLETTFSGAFSCQKTFVFWFECDWSLFLRVKYQCVDIHFG